MNAPVLRFKEFTDKWKTYNLGTITETVTSGSRDWAKYYSDTGSKFIRMTNLSRDGIQLKLDDLRFVNIKSNSADGNRTSLVSGDILISITAELGKIGWIPPDFGEAFINQHTALIRLKKAKTDTKFIAYLLSTTKLNVHINRMNDSGAKAGLNLPTIKSIQIQSSELNEQTKIANFLTAVDEKITLLTQKEDLLSQYKKGVMQQIFSQELRFKDDDGQEFPEWEEKTLGDVLDYEQPTKYLVSSTEYSNDFKTPVLTAGKTFILGYTDETVGICEQGLPVIIFDDFTTAFKFVPFPFKAKSSAMKILRKKDGVNINFIYSAMQKIDFQSGDEHKRYWISEYSRISIRYPSLPEQIKIANFLTAIDDKITNHQTQLNALKQYKQGLLQQLFV